MKSPMEKLELKGGPRERGLAHGEALRDLIAEGLDTWEATVRPPDGITVAEDLAAFLGGLEVLEPLAKWVPGLVEEIEAIATGANQPRDRILAYNLLDEYWCWDAARRPSTDDMTTVGACSAIGVGPRAGAAAIVAQNLDLPLVFEGSAVALEIEEETGPRILALTAAGTVNFCGANELGVAVCCNALPSLSYDGRGISTLGAVRGILRSESLAAAQKFVESAPHATPQNLMVGDPGGVKNIECSANAVVVLESEGDALWHTNHPLENDDRAFEDVRTLVGTSFERAELLAGRIAGVEAHADVVALLRDRTAPLCRVGTAPTESHTWGAIISDLKRPPRVEIAPGPPDRVDFEVIWP